MGLANQNLLAITRAAAEEPGAGFAGSVRSIAIVIQQKHAVCPNLFRFCASLLFCIESTIVGRLEVFRLRFHCAMYFPRETPGAAATPSRWVISSTDALGGQSWQAIFGNDHPLKVDVGCGYGHFLTAMAQAEPHSNFIGIDIYPKGISRAQQKIERLQLVNVRLLAMPAAAALATAFESEQLAALYINFPDPWPKRRHARRRLVQPALVALIHDRLQAQGVVIVATDVAGYAQEMLQHFLAHGGFESCEAAGIVSELPDRVPTLYETKFRRQGLPLFYFKLRKVPLSSSPAGGEFDHEAAGQGSSFLAF